jgi:lysine 2,3-aminomutase
MLNFQFFLYIIDSEEFMKNIEFKETYLKNKNNFYKNVKESLWNDWKWQLRNSINSFEKLSAFYPKIDTDLKNIIENLKFQVTPHFFCLIDFDNFDNDPIAKQVIPSKMEFKNDNFLSIDPFNEKKKRPVSNIVKRYPDRALIVSTNICASYCRYCTRKWNWNESKIISRTEVNNSISYLKNNPQIREAIISGGDPFLLKPEILDNMLGEILALPNIEVVRIATRIAAFLPQKINRKIINILKKHKSVWVITHFNHENEITPDTVKAIDNLISGGVALANQTVLLKGVNDNINSMKNLLRLLESLRIKPYYIFQCDLVEGTSHFRTPLETGLKIMENLRGHIGGLCIPTFVVDLPDGGKVPLLPEYKISETKDKIFFKNYEGKIFDYPKI